MRGIAALAFLLTSLAMTACSHENVVSENSATFTSNVSDGTSVTNTVTTNTVR